MYDHRRRMTGITQTGTGVAQKHVEIDYKHCGKLASIKRYSGTGTTKGVGSLFVLTRRDDKRGRQKGSGVFLS